ncbi:MAG: hypothetical protein LBR37_04095 [Erysipelotrichaceae bacterium]|nr:hypothetical protein [Erysipelotrichaceae bacterium]
MAAFFKTQRDKLIRLITYYKYCQDIVKNNESFVVLHDSASEYNICREFKTRFDNSFDNLDGLEKEFILNDYLIGREKFWWQRHFERSTYFRIKRRAINNFLMELGE